MITMSEAHESMLTTHGLGHLRPASGTWGSIPPVVIAMVMIMAGLTAESSPYTWVYYLVMSLIVIVYSAFCVVLGHEAEAKWGKDPSEVVADETAGQAVTLLFVPFGMCACPLSTIGVMALAFVLFRLFDIFKPWPAGAMQRISGGWGILLDDLIAGAMAGILMLIILRLI